jgi:hypothetical protein
MELVAKSVGLFYRHGISMIASAIRLMTPKYLKQDRQNSRIQQILSWVRILWCQADITIRSTTAAPQVYTLYWVWDWPTAPGTVGQPDGLLEIYTTCIDINLVDGVGTPKGSVSFSQAQDLNSAAISSEVFHRLRRKSNVVNIELYFKNSMDVSS